MLADEGRESGLIIGFDSLVSDEGRGSSSNRLLVLPCTGWWISFLYGGTMGSLVGGGDCFRAASGDRGNTVAGLNTVCEDGLLSLSSTRRLNSFRPASRCPSSTNPSSLDDGCGLGFADVVLGLVLKDFLEGLIFLLGPSILIVTSLSGITTSSFSAFATASSNPFIEATHIEILVV